MATPPPTLRMIQILAASLALGVVAVYLVLTVFPGLATEEEAFEPVLSGSVAIPILIAAAVGLVVIPPVLGRLLSPEGSATADEWAARYLREVLVTFAVMEGSAILMVVVSYLAGRPAWGAAGVCLALLMMAIRFPTTSKVRARVGVAGE